ncbi:uncharacterized protein K460DRAFT_355685 [Cucurbitaria berberidis CBS 394.84]|uniref:Uncharacterized protein n=1 Tax=Cucurbitaria berberidis CBS 394.84 TaxID=1168544 RepID=A0A9P4L8E3_9PLEO|nr:uncharacterized protein K460DRAFT_355685 [Cucurbitaria berberidis CBS 394.84]KAF1845945.1 hypothetical protein K460DRAFT_355685 [Cucurbitaria berberidis CBS 394.84]
MFKGSQSREAALNVVQRLGHLVKELTAPMAASSMSAGRRLGTRTDNMAELACGEGTWAVHNLLCFHLISLEEEQLQTANNLGLSNKVTPRPRVELPLNLIRNSMPRWCGPKGLHAAYRYDDERGPRQPESKTKQKKVDDRASTSTSYLCHIQLRALD